MDDDRSDPFSELSADPAARPVEVGVVHVIDDDDGVRIATGTLLATAGYEVETHGSGVAFLAAVDLDAPGCALLDLRMPGPDGLEVLERLKDRGSPLRAVMITGHGDVASAVRAMKGGASDFIEKPYKPEQLLEAVDRALRLAAAGTAERSAVARAKLATLTPRECQVLSALAGGLSNKAIAFDFGLSVRTVEFHRARLMERLGVRTLPDIMRLAFDAGL